MTRTVATGAIVFGAAAVVAFATAAGQAQRPAPDVRPAIPTVWDEPELASMTLPPARPDGRILYVPAKEYYRDPVLPIYRSYPVYAPGRAPAGYVESLERQQPAVVFDAAALRSEADWIEAGRVIFDTPFGFGPVDNVRDPAWYAAVKPPITADGTITAYRYIIRETGKVEVGLTLCGSCHSRVMPDGSVIKGAQGNFPIEQDYAYRLRKAGTLEGHRKLDYGMMYPELAKDDINHGLYRQTVDTVARAHEAMIPGIVARTGFSVDDMPKTADLIGVKDRKYLDLTARFQHRGIGDLMRYATAVGGANYFFSTATALPPDPGPDPSAYRPGDEQLYALSLYIYSLKPPPNPNPFDARAARGQEIFAAQRCGGCHTPPLYTNNKLTPAGTFEVPAAHRTAYDILDVRVGTDARSATTSVRGRGYYKVPSIKGVWYRGPFEHNGSVLTLEDWFDPARLRSDYVPTGFKGSSGAARAITGHPFGLSLSPDDRQALIAFLRTL
jgi:hypothetical protein